MIKRTVLQEVFLVTYNENGESHDTHLTVPLRGSSIQYLALLAKQCKEIGIHDIINIKHVCFNELVYTMTLEDFYKYAQVETHEFNKEA